MPGASAGELLRAASEARRLGDGPRAEALCRRAVAIDSPNPEATILLARLLADRGAWSEAAAEAERAIAGTGTVRSAPALRRLLCTILLSKGLAEGNAEDLERAEAAALQLVSDGSGGAGVLLARTLAAQGRHGEARHAAAGAIAFPPSPEVVTGVLRWLEQVAGRQHGAESALAPLLSSGAPVENPAMGRALAKFAGMLAQLRLDAQAEIFASEAARRAPGVATVELEAARAERRASRQIDAKRRLESIAPDSVVIGRPSENADDRARKIALVELASILDSEGEHERAFDLVTAAKQSILLDPDAARVRRDEFPRQVAAWRSWVDRADVSRWSAGPATGPSPPVFFVGFPRSGTTLAEHALGSHAGLVGTDEAPLLASAIRAVHSAGGTQLAGAASERPEPGGPEWTESLTNEQVAALRRAYFHAARRTLGPRLVESRRIIDKQPLNITRLGLIRRVFPESKVIVAIRDPRDVCVSCLFQDFALNASTVHFADIGAAASLYDRVMGLYAALRARLDLDLLELRYEELVADFRGQMARVLAFLGLPWDDAVLTFHERAAERLVHTPSAGAVSRPVHAGAVSRWKRYGSRLDPARPA